MYNEYMFVMVVFHEKVSYLFHENVVFFHEVFF